MALVTKPIRLLDNITTNYGKINFLIPDMVIEELNNLSKTKSYKTSQTAKTVLELTTKFQVVTTKKSKYPDDSLIDYASRNNCAIATIDKNLIKRSLSEKILVFSLKSNIVIRI